MAAAAGEVPRMPLIRPAAAAPSPPAASRKARPRPTAPAIHPALAREPAPRPPGGEAPAESPPSPPPTVKPASPPPAPKPAPPREHERQLDELIDGALTGKATGGGEHPAKAKEVEALPQLSRDEIQSAMKSIRPRIKDCYRQFGEKGLAMVRVELGAGGLVKTAAVSGVLANSQTGACVEAAVKTAHFPSSEGLNFSYPFYVR
jgi:hypothetical protein